MRSVVGVRHPDSIRILGLLVVAVLIVACGSDAGGSAGGDVDGVEQDRETTEAAAPEQTFVCSDLVGVWEAVELAGDEEEIGGVYRAVLRLPPSGEVTWSASDYIEAWDSWACVGSEIIGFSDSSVRWFNGEPTARDPNPCTDFTTSAPRQAEPGETIDSQNNWVRCRSGGLEEGAAIAQILADDTLVRNSFTLTR